MKHKIRAHVVFGENSTKVLEEISKHCIITGRSFSLEQAGIWAKDAGGEDPDVFLINSRVFFKGNKEEVKETKVFLRILAQIREYRRKSRIVPLFPEGKRNNTELTAGLLRMNIYDFWFIERFDEADIRNFIYRTRTLADVKGYLNDGLGLTGRIKNIYEPYYVKSNVIAFCSYDDSLINQGVAFLTAVRLAENGFKVALVETITNIPRLAGILSVNHPFCNTRHALTMFVQQGNDFIRNCLFNSVKYTEDGYWQEKDRHLDYLPANLFFLPDGIRKDNISIEQMKENWQAFVTKLTNIIMFEKDFHFLVFICYGDSIYTDAVMKELANLKFITVNMLPESIAYGLMQKNHGPRNVRIIGAKKVAYLLDELKEMEEEPFIYPPSGFTDEVLGYVYLKDFRRISRESWNFIDQITSLVGIRQNDERKKNKVSEGLGRLGNILRIK